MASCAACWKQSIDRLPDEFRVVFVLRAVEGLSVAETAESLSILAADRPDALSPRTPAAAGGARRPIRGADADRIRVRRRSAAIAIVATALRRLEPALDDGAAQKLDMNQGELPCADHCRPLRSRRSP